MSKVRIMKKAAILDNVSEREVRSMVDRFIKSIRSKLIYLEIDTLEVDAAVDRGRTYINFTFNVRMDTLNDAYVDNKVYASGNAYLYLSDRFYSDVDAEASKIFGPEVTVSWNTTGSIGRIYYTSLR